MDTSPKYLLFTVKCRGDDPQQFLVDKEKYPNFSWDKREAHKGYHPAELVLNYEPGVKRVEFPWDNLSWFTLDIGDECVYSAALMQFNVK